MISQLMHFWVKKEERERERAKKEEMQKQNLHYGVVNERCYVPGYCSRLF